MLVTSVHHFLLRSDPVVPVFMSSMFSRVPVSATPLYVNFSVPLRVQWCRELLSRLPSGPGHPEGEEFAVGHEGKDGAISDPATLEPPPPTKGQNVTNISLAAARDPASGKGLKRTRRGDGGWIVDDRYDQGLPPSTR